MLTAKQQSELHAAVLAHLLKAGFADTAAAFQREAGLEAPASAADDDVLERKWTATLRLQRRIEELEARVKELEAEAKAPVRSTARNEDSSLWLPRPPARSELGLAARLSDCEGAQSSPVAQSRAWSSSTCPSHSTPLGCTLMGIPSVAPASLVLPSDLIRGRFLFFFNRSFFFCLFRNPAQPRAAGPSRSHHRGYLPPTLFHCGDRIRRRQHQGWSLCPWTIIL